LFGVPETSFALPHSLTYSLARTGGPLSGAIEGPTLWHEQGARSPARTGGPLSGTDRGPTLRHGQGGPFSGTDRGAHSLARARRPLSGTSRGPTLWREQGAHSLARAGSPLLLLAQLRRGPDQRCRDELRVLFLLGPLVVGRHIQLLFSPHGKEVYGVCQ
jgi:hypothetical protein